MDAGGKSQFEALLIAGAQPLMVIYQKQQQHQNNADGGTLPEGEEYGEHHEEAELA